MKNSRNSTTVILGSLLVLAFGPTAFAADADALQQQVREQVQAQVREQAQTGSLAESKSAESAQFGMQTQTQAREQAQNGSLADTKAAEQAHVGTHTKTQSRERVDARGEAAAHSGARMHGAERGRTGAGAGQMRTQTARPTR